MRAVVRDIANDGNNRVEPEISVSKCKKLISIRQNKPLTQTKLISIQKYYSAPFNIRI